MANYRHRDTGEIKTGGQIKKLHKNTVSFSKVVDTFADLGWEIIGQVAKPEPSTNLKVVEAGATGNDSDGKPIQVWIERDMFADTVEDGVTTTKAEHETAYLAKLAATEAEAAKEAAKTLFDAKAKVIKSDTPEDEVASWTEQKQEAEAWTADNNAETWLLDSIINRTKEDKQVLVTKILAKSKAYKQALGDAIGERQS